MKCLKLLLISTACCCVMFSSGSWSSANACIQSPSGASSSKQQQRPEDDLQDRHRDRFERHRPIQLEPLELNVLSGRIDNDLLRERFIDAGRSLIQAPQALTSEQISAVLDQRTKPVSIPQPQVPSRTKIQYADIAKASLMFGTIYDCGRCNNIHENVAGGVVISTDGLAVTNYHVLDQHEAGNLAMFALTFDGTPRPILEVLYANQLADVALVRLGGAAPFHPAPISSSSPMPLDPVTVLSHPKHNFFVLTTGVVNRHVQFRGRGGEVENWLEVTAEYAAGSSGSGVFDGQGALIGLVSSNAPLPRVLTHRPNRSGRGRPENETYYEMTLRRCVTLEAIRSCFAANAK